MALTLRKTSHFKSAPSLAYTTNDVQDHPYVSKLFTTISSAPPNKTEEIPTSSEDEDEEENDVQSVDLDLDADQLDNLLSTRTLKDKPCFELSDVLVISFKVQNWDEDTTAKLRKCAEKLRNYRSHLVNLDSLGVAAVDRYMPGNADNIFEEFNESLSTSLPESLPKEKILILYQKHNKNP
ncbi:uncharacterized protein LOC110854964 [Folsomia candida]|uniref:Uncharacterized protein n=1 Tax=Folsomia candida TaxID=158441 RepID=A0A226DTE1_FOLCA|nr:uncharacterized protein LOC110854964 [Folsomia candida]OXA48752.1 hypothetical protein Fcan01_16311 [Folsomia candida]